MATDTGICNSALLKIGATRISSLTQGTKNANACQEQYEKLRDDLLRQHAWNFAVKRRKLAQLTEAPTYEFDHAYQLPTDWLRVLAVHDNDAGHGTVEYRIEEAKTLLSSSDEIWLTFVRQVVDANEMTPDFRETLAAYLARELAIPIAESNSLWERMDIDYRRRLRRARSADSIEDFPARRPAGSWVNARHRTHGLRDDWPQ